MCYPFLLVTPPVGWIGWMTDMAKSGVQNASLPLEHSQLWGDTGEIVGL